MGLKTFKPYTKSTRGTIILDKSNLWKGSPYKSLSKGKKSSGEETIMEELLRDIKVVALKRSLEI